MPKKEIPLTHAESGYYFEWELEVDGTKYCIINNKEDWTILQETPNGWEDSPFAANPKAFIKANELELGE